MLLCFLLLLLLLLCVLFVLFVCLFCLFVWLVLSFCVCPHVCVSVQRGIVVCLFDAQGFDGGVVLVSHDFRLIDQVKQSLRNKKRFAGLELG